MRRVISMLIVACMLLAPNIVFANDAAMPILTEMVSSAVVSIEAGNHTGSGFFINSSGFILTSGHVVKDATQVLVKLNNGESLNGEVFIQGEKDYAIIKTNRNNTPSLRLGNSKAVKQGETILIMGSPKGLSNTASRGIVSNPLREVNGSQFMQIDASLNPGNSGGPIINMSGEVVGIATATMVDAQGIGFVLPIETTFLTFLDKGIPVNTSLTNEELALQKIQDDQAPMIPSKFANLRWFYFAAGIGGVILVLAAYFYFRRRHRDRILETDVTIEIQPPEKDRPQDDDIDITLH